MWLKKPINPILVCPLIALLLVFLIILLIFQLSQFLFINHYQDYRLYDDDSYWNRRRPAVGLRTHRTNSEIEWERDRQILAELIADSRPNRNLNELVDKSSIRLKQRIVRRADDFQSGPKQVDNFYLKEPNPKILQDEENYNREAPRGGWPMLNLSVGRTKVPISDSDYPTQPETNLYDFVDDFGNLNKEVENLNEGSGMDKLLVDASVISDEEGDFGSIPPLSRIVLLH